MNITRRQLLVGSLVTAGGLVLAGCGRGEGTGGGDDAAAGPGFPVTIEHRFGTTTIERAPQRVVTIGYSDHDAVMALGVPVAGVRYWYGPEGDAIQPWAEDAARQTGSQPQILTMETPDPEKIAAASPDLVIGIYSDLEQGSYDLISAIAPTVAAPAQYADYGVPWQETTRIVGRALGRSEQAEQAVAGVEARFAAAREANPQWAGKEVAVATRSADKLGVFASHDLRSQFFTELGFVVPARFDELSGENFYADLSFEQSNELERDLVVWDQLSFTPGGRATVEADPLISRLAVTREGRTVFLEGATELAFAWQTVLSLPAALDGVLPLLEQALPKT
ncbi:MULTISPECIES: ABC transporter substrate-binding protein [Pseudonocardia]|uniref:Fe(3+)-citrate-binding protein YfmC n=2 Tax=Pseudonocardia TaxID=1847 RepID=A0A1Y2MSD5_PSEAH|nr:MULTISPECIES: ABC transporter substrate-binding protein [Pseudonocardia]OSY38134.1 Fe(3+)-citrate-binding protein YfmC precursor [Pseudonocardia autotrophica]TDN75575.1 iron complex transport system substrate-binding protein [Pseudonocardia autotrophica]BBF99545.1 ABC transporter substrate-binding protein [Pseudonocardia autotrophica]GEC27784.1 ABC transporter substrate-binding protein [Pseudonocardia saturnea]